MTEETFVRELERRADHVHGAPFSFDDVRGKARSIQRRRRTAVAGAAAAVVAAAIVLPMTLTGGSDGTSPDPAPSPTTSTPTTPPSTPGAPVLHDGVLTLGDGTTVPVDVGNAVVLQLAVLTDGRIIVASDRPYRVRVYAPDGELESDNKVAINQITVSADNRLVTWLDDDTRIVVLESGVAEPTTFTWGVPMPGEGVGSIDGIHGSDCANGGCTVLVGDFATTTSVLRLVTEPAEDLGTSEPLRIEDVGPDGALWAVTFPPGEGEQFGCSGLYDPAAEEVVAQSCDATVWQFSPDGAHVTSARSDGGTWGSVEVLDQDLALVLSFTPDGDDVIKTWGWADPEHLLVVVAALDDPSEWTLLSVPIDGGEPEVVAGPVPGPSPELSSLFVLSD